MNISFRKERAWVRLVGLGCWFGLVAASTAPAPGADNGLGERPYMGWTSWSLCATKASGYGESSWLTEAHVDEQSQALARTLQPHGYLNLNVDAGWRGGWDESGRPTVNPHKFPHGMSALAAKIHERGQKFGIYYVPGIDDDLARLNPKILGTSTHIRDILLEPKQQGNHWGGRAIDFSKPGAQEYIQSIADLFAGWGVDFLKYDGVAPGSEKYDLTIDARPSVAAWGQALIRTKRPIWLTVSWGIDLKYHDFWKQHANAWRTGNDVESYDSKLTHWPQVALRWPQARDSVWAAGRGKGWNDLDALLVGNATMTDLTQDERRSAMTLWAIACSPLYSGDDLTKLDPFGLELLTNDEVIAVDQAGIPAQPIGSTLEVWSSLQADGSRVVALFNLDAQATRTITVNLADLGIATPARAHDLWLDRDIDAVATRLEATLPPHACRLVRLTAP